VSLIYPLASKRGPSSDLLLQSFTNRGKQSFVSNRINGNLQCKSNTPKPTGYGNVVGGNKEGQCARL
jgi:hypothetical protein